MVNSSQKDINSSLFILASSISPLNFFHRFGGNFPSGQNFFPSNKYAIFGKGKDSSEIGFKNSKILFEYP